jgi:hypothetical protein
MSLASLKTGNIRFDSGYFVITPPGNNGSSCITQLECGNGEWTTDSHTLRTDQHIIQVRHSKIKDQQVYRFNSQVGVEHLRVHLLF